MKTILIVDDELGTRESLKAIFWKIHQVVAAESVKEALEILQHTRVDLIILDVVMPEQDGMEFLKEIRIRYRDLPVIMASALTTPSTMAEAIRLGAVDFIHKPFDVEAVRAIADKSFSCVTLRHQHEADRREAVLDYPLHSITGEAPSFRMAMHQAQNIASHEGSLLLLGECGSGLELMGRYIHSLSNRANQPFISLHCSSMPGPLLEAELFGRDNPGPLRSGTATMGRLELANSGTLLLKGLDTLPSAIQEKLLGVLEKGTFNRPGSGYQVTTNARIIFASSGNLKEQSILEKIHPELLKILLQRVIEIPPLRERSGDIPLLAYSFLNYFRQRMNRAMSDIDNHAMDLLRAYTWPGNVRELRNIIERAVVIYGDRKTLLAIFLPHELQKSSAAQWFQPDFKGTLKDTVNNLQREIIGRALVESKWKYKRAARLLGTTPRILNYRMKQLKIESTT